MSEIRMGGRNPITLVAHDELQFFDARGSAAPPDDSMWFPVRIVEAEKPENPHEKEDRERRERVVQELTHAMEKVPPVDRTQRVLTDGSPVTEDHREIKSNGMQKAYVVLSAEERAKGFVRPVRQSYVHKTCGVVTHMGLALAETYARDPGFYSGTFCVSCKAHFPLDQFTWDGTDEVLGT